MNRHPDREFMLETPLVMKGHPWCGERGEEEKDVEVPGFLFSTQLCDNPTQQ